MHPCGYEDMVVWQRRIQSLYIAPRGGIGNDWNWPALLLGCHVSEQGLGRRAVAFQLRVSNDQGDAVPVAQAILSLPYYWPADHRDRCVFVWFVAASPADALKAYGVHERFSVLPPLLDTAIQISIGHEMGGRIGLHADGGGAEAQNEALMERYRKCGLSQRSRLGAFFRFPFRRDDGRLFYFTGEDALAFAAKQDDLR